MVSFSVNTFLVHLDQRSMGTIAITWRLSSVKFYILIFFSETNGPIGTKLGRNVHWMILKVFFLLVHSEIHYRNKRPEGAKKGFSVFISGLFYFTSNFDQSFFLSVSYKFHLSSMSTDYVERSYRPLCENEYKIDMSLHQ